MKDSYRERKYRKLLRIPYIFFLFLTFFLLTSHYRFFCAMVSSIFFCLFPSYYFPFISFSFFPFLLIFLFPSLPFPLLFPFSCFILAVFPSYPVYLSICFYFPTHLYFYPLRPNFCPLFVVILVYILLFSLSFHSLPRNIPFGLSRLSNVLE